MIFQKLKSKLSRSDATRKTLFVFISLFLGIYVFCIPTFGEREGILRYSIYGAMVCLGICSLLYCFLFDDFRVNRKCFYIPLFSIFAFVGTAIFSQDFRSWVTLILLAISFFVFFFSFKAIKNKFVIINIIALALFVFSAYYIFKYRNEILNFKSFGNKGFRIVTIFDNQNGVAAYSIVGIALSMYVLLFAKTKIRYLHLIPIASFSVVGITTGSRTFFVLYVIILLFFLYFKFKKHKLLFFAIVAFLIVAMIVIINLPFMATLKTRILSALGTFFGSDTKVDNAAMERVIWMDYAFYLGEKNLLIGYGCNGFPLISGVGTYSHSNYSEVLCNFGIIGSILFYIPLFVCLFKSIRLKTNEKIFVITIFVYYFIASFTNVIYYKKIYYLILSLLFFLCFPAEEDNKFFNKCQNVLFTCDTMGCGGAERVISILSNGFKKKGIAVSIVGVGDKKEPKSFYQLDEGISYISLGFKNKQKKINPVLKIFRLRKTIKTIQPDIIISFLPVANIYTCFALLGTGIPYVVSERNDPKRDPKSKILRLLKKYSFLRSRGVVFQTIDAMEFYSNRIQRKSTVIENPLFGDISSEYLPNKSRSKTIIAVGRFSPQKNYKMLLDAFNLFYKDYRKDYELHIYGDGELKHGLTSYTNSLESKTNIVFKGNDNQWQKKENNASLFVLCSDYEGQPNSLIESLALGITSISTDCPCGGPKSMLNPQYLVPVGDADSLAKKMAFVLENDYHLSKEDVRKHRMLHDPNCVVDKWLKFLGNLSK